MIELFQRVTYLQIEGSDLQGIICKELEIEDLSPEVSGDDSGGSLHFNFSDPNDRELKLSDQLFKEEFDELLMFKKDDDENCSYNDDQIIHYFLASKIRQGVLPTGKYKVDYCWG